MITVKSIERPVVKIGTDEVEEKFVLQLANQKSVNDKEIIDFCQKHTMIPAVYIKATVESLCQTIIHYLMLGYNVKLSDLGNFYLTLDSTAVDTSKKAGLSQLKDVYIRFRPNKELIDKVRKVEVSLEGVYKLVDKDKKIYEKLKSPQASGSDVDDGDTDTGDSGGNTSPDSGGNTGGNDDGGFAG